jgi:hypothetical protein
MKNQLHSISILVTQNTANALGIEDAFDNHSLWQVPVAPEHDEVRVFCEQSVA